MGIQIRINMTTFPLHVDITNLLLPAPLVPELQPSLLAQCAVHCTTVQTLPAELSRSLHVITSDLKTRKFNALLLGHRHGVFSIFNGERHTKARTRTHRRRIGTSGQSIINQKLSYPHHDR